MATRAAVLGRGGGWVGIREDTGNNDCRFSREWGIDGQSWCFAFIHSCFAGELPHRYMYVPYGVDYARATGQALEWEQVDQVQAGDVVFYTWGNGYGRWTPGTGDHVGIVAEPVSDGYNFTAIEGNTRPPGVSGYDGVFRRTDRTLDQVVCFWRPAVYTDQEEDLTPEEHNWLGRTVAILERINLDLYTDKSTGNPNLMQHLVQMGTRNNLIAERVNRDVYTDTMSEDPNLFRRLDDGATPPPISVDTLTAAIVKALSQLFTITPTAETADVPVGEPGPC